MATQPPTQTLERPAMPGMPQFFNTRALGMDFQFARVLGAQTYGGSELGECFITARRIADGDPESWYREWSASGERVEGLAAAALAGGHRVSAREAYLRSFSYYRSATFFLMFDDPRRRAAWQKSRDCFIAAGKLFDPPAEVLSLPFEGMQLPGYFLRPPGPAVRRPTVLLLGGWDSTCEECYFLAGGAAAVRRGWNVLQLEGPGQVSAAMLNPGTVFRHDYERPVGAFIDYLLSRDDVDPERLALCGYSMGGHFVLRVAAFEKRLRACVANPPIPNLRKGLMVSNGLLPVDEFVPNADDQVDWSNPTVRWFANEARGRMGVSSVTEWMEALRPYDVGPYEEQISCRVLCVASEGEGVLNPPEALVPGHVPTQARRFYERLNVPKAWHFFTSAEGAEAHCQLNNLSRMHSVEFDWLEEVFASPGS